jgi:hypothetical protein
VTVDKHSLEILQPVVESAREELDDMEQDDIPAGLRKAARSSARKLPPPLARSVVKELVRNDSFRSAVAERYGARDEVDELLVAFLDEPDSAIAAVAERGTQITDGRTRSEIDDAHQRIGVLEGQLAEAKRRTAALRTQHIHELEAARSEVSLAQTRAEARMEKMAITLSESRDEVVALIQEIHHLSTDLASAEDKVVSAVEKSRRRGATVGQQGQVQRTDPAPSDPLELARWLDGVERNVRPFRAKGVVAHRRSAVVPLQIQPGLAPDSPSSLVSLIEQQPRRFLLDGYNIGGEIHADGFSTRSARDDVIRHAGKLARSTEAEVRVVFDGPDDEERPGFRSAAGVVVSFSRGDKADDVIAALVASEPDRTVVITNDRELRDRCTVEGCIPIWSSAFLEWLRY